MEVVSLRIVKCAWREKTCSILVRRDHLWDMGKCYRKGCEVLDLIWVRLVSFVNTFMNLRWSRKLDQLSNHKLLRKTLHHRLHYVRRHCYIKQIKSKVYDLRSSWIKPGKVKLSVTDKCGKSCCCQAQELRLRKCCMACRLCRWH
jgi:hypothetical protein